MAETWQENIKNAPRATGVYLMKDSEGRVIYAGKAKNLKSRTRAYINGTDQRPMIPFLASRIANVEFIVTGTEKEALILENSLIKKHRPKYNVNLRDDKTYYSLRLDPKQAFPRLQLVRQVKKDGARYFGPYPSGGAARETLNFIQPIFPLRTCGDGELKSRRRPCIEYEIKRCLAPCAGLVTGEAYASLVRDCVAFLEGRERGLLGDLNARMQDAAERLEFEEAALLRDRIADIEKTLEKQQMVAAGGRDQDVVGLCRAGEHTQVCLLNIVKGRLLGKKTFPLVTLPSPPEEILSSLLAQHYDKTAFIPGEIILPFPLPDREALSEWLSDTKGAKVTVIAPKKGRARELLAMAEANAAEALKAAQRSADESGAALDLLAEKLSLKKRPDRMECFDISNVSGRYAVASLACFVKGRPDKDRYRRFRIRAVPDMDDYAMMREVLRRRYETVARNGETGGKSPQPPFKKGAKGEQAKKEKQALPDLVVVDGGKGQVGVAVTVFKDLGIGDVDIIGLAKADRREGSSAADRREDRVYLPRRKDPLDLSRWPAALFLLQRLRDEAHRFAIAYHHKVKEKEDFHSLLDDIPGLGDAKKKALLRHFGHMEEIRAASPEDLQKVTGIGKGLSVVINKFFEKGSADS